MAKLRIFEGSAVALVTPMRDDFSINDNKLGELIDWHIAESTDCLVICGTTGEASTLSDEEHVSCIRSAVEKVAGRIPVIAGCGSNNTAYAIWLSQQAKQAGADGLLHVTPYYNKTSQNGLIAHFTAIADATDLPIILYNVPSRTGMGIHPQTYHTLSKHPNIVATKEANGDLTAVARTMALCGEDLVFYSGDDNLTIPMMSLGALGVVSVLANIMPGETHTLCQHYLDGNANAAGRMQVDLMGIIDVLFCDISPIPVKTALSLMGKNAGPCRLPLTELGAQEKSLLQKRLAQHGLVQETT